MRIREPIVAGQFYPSDPDAARVELEECLVQAVAYEQQTEGKIYGGLVPHAGWTYSGAVAAGVFKALAAQAHPDVLIMFGGVHRYRGKEAAMFGSGRWDTPLGPIDIDARLAERIMGYTHLIVDDPFAHEMEHSLEVQMGFVKHLFPDTKILPMMVPTNRRAHEVGLAVARTISAYKYNVLVVGTTDLTHYGPAYGFEPHGQDDKGHTWAKEDNDRRFINLVCGMQIDKLVTEAVDYRNACSSGAVAATSALVQAMGASNGLLLEHTNSREVCAKRGDRALADSVGYAGIIFT